jgi:oligopeptide/dipeptide ABC transporter ATP-binding protein
VANYGFAIVEAVFSLAILLLISVFIIGFCFEEKSDKKIYRLSSLVTSAIVFGMILGIRMLFETFGMWIQIFRILNNDPLYFAIMVTIFFFLNKKFLPKFGFSRISDEKRSQNNNFKKIFIRLIIIAWVLAGIFLSMTFLQIELRDPAFPNYPDKFALGVLWSFSVVFICILITSIINRMLSDEKRIEKKVLKSAIYGAGFAAFSLWFIQLVIFEVYINKWLGFEIIKQDIRMLFLVVVGLYTTFFFNLLRGKLLPESSEKSAKRVKKLLVSELRKQSNVGEDTELLLEDEDFSTAIISEEQVTNYPQGISLKIYVYLLKKLNISSSLDEEVLKENKLNKKSNKIIAGLSLGIPIIVILLVRMLFPLNSLIEVLFLSCICAFFLVVADLVLVLLFHKMSATDKRISKSLLQQTTLYGGVAAFWIWIIPFFVIYSYLFIVISDIVVLNLTFITILSVMMFVLGTRILLWYATSIKMWDAAMKKAPFVRKKASRVNLAWIIANLPLRIFLFLLISGSGIYYSNLLSSFWAGDVWPTQYNLLFPFLLNELFIVVINVIIGLIMVLKVYKRNVGESLKFVVISLIVIYLTTIIMSISIGLFQSLILSYYFSFQDLRIPLIVAAGIYTITIFASLKIKIVPETSKKMEEQFRAALKPYEESKLQGPIAGGREPILDVQDLTTYFYTEEGVVRAVEGVSFKIFEGETLGLVGETGCGKSVTALSILRLVRPPGEIKSGRVVYEGEDLHQKSEEEFLKYRGNRITMIFQDPLNSLNPVFKVGDQIAEVYRLHMEDELLIEATKKNTSIYDIARKWSQKVLKDLNIPMPRIIFDRYPHELSGGMRQRIQIAMGLACSPKLLIADEPTTALDVTIQNQILQLMKNLKKKYNTSILFITHDLGIISKMCDRVAVMYSGFIVEYGDIEKLFVTPYHPYTRGLISSVPVVGKKREILEVIPGMVPNLIYPPSGCRFHPRCRYCFEPCDSKIPKSIETEPDYFVACHLYDPKYKDLAEISIKKAESTIIDVPIE